MGKRGVWRGGVSRLQARGGPLLEGGGQRLAALVANLVVFEIEPPEPRRCPLLAEGGGQRLAALVAKLFAEEAPLFMPEYVYLVKADRAVQWSPQLPLNGKNALQANETLRLRKPRERA